MKRIAFILAVVTCLAGTPATARAAFGIDDFDLVFTSAGDEILTQAGEHPFALEISWDSNVSGVEPEGHLRELFLDLPPGLVASATSTPLCTREDFAELDEGVNACSNSSAVGVVATSFDEPGKWAVAPVFSLVASAGAVASLGFRVAGAANVVVDIHVSEDLPHRLVASSGDFPETVDLFGAKLQLWGVPADQPHDGLRGQCGAYTTTLPPGDAADFEFESLVGACPVGVEERPLLTLPTACEGPLATFYEVLSWEDDVDVGATLTHDEAGTPQGMTGCGALSFSPLFDLAPTTEEAKSPSGLDFSLQFSDEGLANPAGIAESTVRDLVLALPEGMAAAPGLSDDAGACSEADFAEESLEDAPGDGCPDSSEVGTVALESTLLTEAVDGTVYRATPFANAAEDSPMALYVVAEDEGLGIHVKQPVGIEPDPETGQLVFFAEELPQLPFSDLHLQLDGAGGPLITPPFCGEYESVAEFLPWAGGSPYRASVAFQIVSGPNEGPCPVEQSETGPSLPPPAAAPPLAPAGPRQISPRRRHRCPKGKRRVRRKGKVRCVKRSRRKAGDRRPQPPRYP
jgi:hypothetical protein